jgi:hypothetical protein
MKTNSNFGLKILASVAALALVACGTAKKDSASKGSAGGAGGPGSTAEVGLQLKNAALLSQAVENSFGAGRDLIPDPSQTGRNANADAKTSCFEVHKHTLGSESNLRFGEIFADSPSTQYFMSLTICASKVAAACKTDVDAQGAASRCDCSTTEKARAMLQRAVPQVNFSEEAQIAVVEKVAQGCKADYKGTIASIVSSLAFAQR